MTYIRHITLTSGHIVDIRRDRLSEAEILAAHSVIDQMLSGASPEIRPGYTGFASASGGNLMTTITPVDDDLPILTSGVATKSRSSPRLWRLLHDQPTLPLATNRAEVPSAPWCGDRIEAGAAIPAHQSALDWTGRLCIAIAWAWLDKQWSH